MPKSIHQSKSFLQGKGQLSLFDSLYIPQTASLRTASLETAASYSAAPTENTPCTPESPTDPVPLRACNDGQTEPALKYQSQNVTEVIQDCFGQALEPSTACLKTADAKSTADLLVSEIDVAERQGVLPNNPTTPDCPARSSDKRHDSHLESSRAKLQDYVDDLIARNGFVEEGRTLGTPAYFKIFLSLGFRRPSEAKSDANRPLRDIVDRAAAKLGLGPKRYRPSDAQYMDLSFKDAIDIGTERFRTLEGTVPSTSSQARFKSALSKLMAHLGKSASDMITTELTVDFGKLLLEISAQHSNEDTRRHFRRDIQRWHEILKPYLTVTTLPTSFAEALNVAVRRSPYRTATAIAREIDDVHSTTVENWLNGKSEPQGTEGTVVRKLEVLLGLTPDTLQVRLSTALGSTKFRQTVWPDWLRTDTRLRKLLRPLLPEDFLVRTEEQRDSLLRTLVIEAKSSIPYRRDHLKHGRWRLVVRI